MSVETFSVTALTMYEESHLKMLAIDEGQLKVTHDHRKRFNSISIKLYKFSCRLPMATKS